VLRAAGVLETLAHFTEQPDLAGRLAETRA
jgi:hypothetical protein